MSWNGYLMTAPIGMGDISQAVGHSSLDLGTLVAKGSIQKWALHKPVRLLSGSDTVADISSYNTWLSYMQNSVAKSDGTGTAPFGLLVGTSTNLYDIIGTNSAPTVDWVYQQPPESGTFWRRMLDFNGYTNQPNVPINAPGDFTYYTAQDVTNVIELDTNDGEAGDTSIPVEVLTQLNSYQLMLVIKNTYVSPNNWHYTVLSGSIMNAVDSATHLIPFALPPSIQLNNNTSTGYDAYLVGVASSAQLVTGQWFQSTDANMQNFYSMIPLPFANKTDCNFKFKVATDPANNIVHYNYTLYLTHNYVLKYVEFKVWIYRNVAPPTSFSVTFNNIKVYPDYDYQHTTNFPLTNEIFTFGGSSGQAFTWDSSTRKSSASIMRDVSRFNYTLDAYPELTYDKSNSSNYGWEGGDFEIKYID